MSNPPPQRTELKWLAVDLDGTLVRTTPPDYDLEHGEIFWDRLSKLDAALFSGFKIVIHTSRPWSDYELIEWWLRDNVIPFDRIVCGKLLAAAYIDDRNISPDAERWHPYADV